MYFRLQHLNRRNGSVSVLLTNTVYSTSLIVFDVLQTEIHCRSIALKFPIPSPHGLTIFLSHFLLPEESLHNFLQNWRKGLYFWVIQGVSHQAKIHVEPLHMSIPSI